MPPRPFCSIFKSTHVHHQTFPPTHHSRRVPLKQLLLPTSYPTSVHKSYLRFHVWQALETSLAAAVSVLCNQALLTSVGVREEGAIIAAVAIQWMIKDASGEVAKLLFIRRFSPYFDSHPKTFKMAGEILTSVGSALQLCTLFFPSHFLLFATSGNIFKLTGWAIWGTTHIKFVRLFATAGNMGDVAAKHEAQSSVASILGWSAGIATLAISHSPTFLVSAFAIATPIHFWATYKLLKAATFETMTVPRALVLAKQYHEDDRILSLAELDRSPHIKWLGEVGIGTKLRLDREVEDVVKTEEELNDWEDAATILSDEKYLLINDNLFLHPESNPRDLLKGILHHVAYHEGIKYYSKAEGPVSAHGRFVDAYRWTNRNVEQWIENLRKAHWRVQEVGWADKGYRVAWKIHQIPNEGTNDD